MSVDLTPAPVDPTAAPQAQPVRPIDQDEPRITWTKSWAWVWPKLLAIVFVGLLWEIAVWSEWKPTFVLPTPGQVFSQLWHSITGHRLWSSSETTMKRALSGYALAILIGTLLGIAMEQWNVLRRAFGSLIAGLQTMPSIVWFPFAILFFGASEKAILFVVVLGAAPSVASGVLAGIDEVPPPLLRAGHMIGARGINRYRYVVLPAAMPTYVQGLRQGWAFAWRTLLAGELIVQLSGKTSLGSDLGLAANFGDARLVWALMIVILIIGMIVDGVFSALTTRIRKARGLTGSFG